MSKGDYTYDATGNILTWQQQADTDAPTLWVYGYDAADQLTSAVHETTGATPAIIHRYAYTYDPAGNRTSEQIDDAVTVDTHDSLNRLLTKAPGGPVVLQGTLNEPGRVTINGQPVPLSAADEFKGAASVAPGTNTVTINAVDASGNAATAVYEVDQAGTGKTFTYDANGNMTSDGTRTFEWDGRNQPIAINEGEHRSEFTYDPDNRRVRIVEKENSTIVSDHRFVWDRNEIAECRDPTGVLVTARVCRNGLHEIGEAQMWTRDQVMSIREVTDVSASLQSRCEYAPFGIATQRAGIGSDLMGFTGVLEHDPSGLLLMKRRAYDSAAARWLSEDPIGLREGPNLYSYVAKRPLTWFDPEGSVGILVRSNRRLKREQDNKCSQPAGPLNVSSCYKRCCQDHDRCYATFGCTDTSWQTFVTPIDICDLCNWTVVLCVLTANPIGQCDTCSK